MGFVIIQVIQFGQMKTTQDFWFCCSVLHSFRWVCLRHKISSLSLLFGPLFFMDAEQTAQMKDFPSLLKMHIPCYYSNHFGPKQQKKRGYKGGRTNDETIKQVSERLHLNSTKTGIQRIVRWCLNTLHSRPLICQAVASEQDPSHQPRADLWSEAMCESNLKKTSKPLLDWMLLFSQLLTMLCFKSKH